MCMTTPQGGYTQAVHNQETHYKRNMEQKTERESKHNSLQNEECREDDMLLSVATQVQWDISARAVRVDSYPCVAHFTACLIVHASKNTNRNVRAIAYTLVGVTN